MPSFIHSTKLKFVFLALEKPAHLTCRFIIVDSLFVVDSIKYLFVVNSIKYLGLHFTGNRNRSPSVEHLIVAAERTRFAVISLA